MKSLQTIIQEKLRLGKEIKNELTKLSELKDLSTIHCLLIRPAYKPVYCKGTLNIHDNNLTMCGPYKKLSGGLNVCLVTDYIENESYDKKSIIAASYVYYGVILIAAEKEYFDILSENTYDEIINLWAKYSNSNKVNKKEFNECAKKIIENDESIK